MRWHAALGTAMLLMRDLSYPAQVCLCCKYAPCTPPCRDCCQVCPATSPLGYRQSMKNPSDSWGHHPSLPITNFPIKPNRSFPVHTGFPCNLPCSIMQGWSSYVQPFLNDSSLVRCLAVQPAPVAPLARGQLPMPFTKQALPHKLERQSRSARLELCCAGLHFPAQHQAACPPSGSGSSMFPLLLNLHDLNSTLQR